MEAFAGTGSFLSRVNYMRMFLLETISPRTICKVSIISSGLAYRDPVLPGRDKKRPGKHSFYINGT